MKHAVEEEAPKRSKMIVIKNVDREAIEKLRHDILSCADHEEHHGYSCVRENEMGDICGEWDTYVVKGLTRYCGVSIGHKTQGEDEEEENSDDENRGGYDLVDQGRKYYLAFHQWSAFAGWLESRTPEERGMVREFEVRW